jgi:hypothetical protein
MDEPLSAAEVDEILAALRAGAQVSTPGSRCHSDFGHDADGWYRIVFDEGATFCLRIDERAMRQQLQSTPDIGRTLLRRRRGSEPQRG